jgi:uncharacterized Zn-binding protein involved in type VI secretion
MPPAARKTADKHNCPIHGPGPIVKGEPTVLIGNMPAARKGDKCHCGSKIAKGCPTVKIGNKDAARLGDPTSHGVKVITGMPTVLIGEEGKGECLKSAAASGSAFVKQMSPEKPIEPLKAVAEKMQSPQASMSVSGKLLTPLK